MRQYSSDLVTVTWVPVFDTGTGAILGAASALSGVGDLSDGLAPGTFIQPAENAARWRAVPDGMGGVKRIRIPSEGGTLTMQFHAESLESMLLTTLANLDLATGAVVGPIVIFDANIKETSIYTECFLISQPDNSKSTFGSVIPWVWSYTERLIQPIGFQANVVGS